MPKARIRFLPHELADLGPLVIAFPLLLWEVAPTCCWPSLPAWQAVRQTPDERQRPGTGVFSPGESADSHALGRRLRRGTWYAA